MKVISMTAAVAAAICGICTPSFAAASPTATPTEISSGTVTAVNYSDEPSPLVVNVTTGQFRLNMDTPDITAGTHLVCNNLTNNTVSRFFGYAGIGIRSAGGQLKAVVGSTMVTIYKGNSYPSVELTASSFPSGLSVADDDEVVLLSKAVDDNTWHPVLTHVGAPIAIPAKGYSPVNTVIHMTIKGEPTGRLSMFGEEPLRDFTMTVPSGARLIVYFTVKDDVCRVTTRENGVTSLLTSSSGDYTQLFGPFTGDTWELGINCYTDLLDLHYTDMHPGELAFRTQFMDAGSVGKVTLQGTIDERDFATMRNLMIPNVDIKDVTISQSGDNPVDYIPMRAFEDCYWLKSITLPETLKGFRNNGFTSSGLNEVVIPETVVSIGLNQFNAVRSLTKVWVKWAKPLPISWCVFNGSGRNSADGTLYVPFGTKQTYAADSQWGQFTNIVEYDPASITEVAADSGDGLSISVSRGAVTISGPSPRHVAVTGIDGRLVHSVPAGAAPVTLALPAGVYIMEGRKIMVP
ncbi:MAG: leucine-rich repeat domain-containing protein [Candidatus Amulumruptor caecigallinarius]|nr:leucine-rich repeat domain-containing protein [Candidatus Amulumruptor caecigallinarius]MCM1395865.1 leucine-rich repeat domain-containing protein [Candidatus Amulumruptor caecigallinarius]MCM1454804.1 leucine-rich repeat domain-containing protein [bacterium]